MLSLHMKDQKIKVNISNYRQKVKRTEIVFIYLFILSEELNSKSFVMVAVEVVIFRLIIDNKISLKM